MRKDELISSIRSTAELLRREGVEHVALFGSRAREDGGTESDIDLLIDVREGAHFSLLNLSGVALLIEDATGIPAQVILRRSAPDDFLRRIADDISPVF